jgi:hypothetical protein
MTSKIEIDGKKLTSIKEACSEVSYSRDYVTRLAREGKIVASLIGRQWYVDLLSLQNYVVQSKVESEVRKAQLSEERKQEQLFHKTKEQQDLSLQKSTASVRTRAVMASGSVLALGLIAGVFGYAVFATPLDLNFALSQPQQSGMTQSSQTAANANAVSGEQNVPLPENVPNPAPLFSSKAVAAFDSPENGVLILPQGEESADPAAVFSDEVYIATATSGQRTAVLVDAQGVKADREVPFVLVPVKTDQN